MLYGILPSSTLKGWFTQNQNLTQLLLTTMSIGSPVTFFNPRITSRISWREIIPPSASTIKAYDGQVVKHHVLTWKCSCLEGYIGYLGKKHCVSVAASRQIGLPCLLDSCWQHVNSVETCYASQCIMTCNVKSVTICCPLFTIHSGINWALLYRVQ